jgi:ribose transport system permease protein
MEEPMTTLSEPSPTAPTGAPPPPPEPRGWQQFIRGFNRPGEASLLSRYALVGVWLLVTGFFAIVEPGTLLTTGTFQTIFGSQQALVFLGMAAVVTFAVGEFDLSISAMLGLAATLVPVLVVVHGWSPLTACVVAVLACAAVGALNGVIVVVLGIDAIIATLGMSTLILGLTTGFAHSEAVSGLSDSFGNIANHVLALGLPMSFYYGLALALVIAYVMRFTALGRNMAFVGANREVARLAGVKVSRIRIGSYVVSGILCGLGGVLLTAAVGGFDPNSSPTYLLPALSATFLGTAVVKPGRFNPMGTMVAIYFLVTGIVGLQLLGYSGWVSDVFYGAALIIAVIVSTLTRRRTVGA